MNTQMTQIVATQRQSDLGRDADRYRRARAATARRPGTFGFHLRRAPRVLLRTPRPCADPEAAA